jgi:hypothetical protein
LIKIFLKYERWVVEIVDIRDEITYLSDLEGFSCFIIHAYKGGGFVDISYPSMPDGKRARKFMEESWSTLTRLISEIDAALSEYHQTSRTATMTPTIQRALRTPEHATELARTILILSL